MRISPARSSAGTALVFTRIPWPSPRCGPDEFRVYGMAWFAGTLRAWHLAVLRYAVTLDNADRLAVLRIAREIDRLYPRQDGSTDFEFFRRTSAELCAAILQPNERALTRLATTSGPD